MPESFFDRINKNRTQHTPDVLSCLANLSNDEVFTPPEIVNRMLDLLPQELFESPDTTFLDPACKTGVFLREIAKRLLVGLEPKIPDLQERINHIFHKQLYGIAITELTSLLARRSLYCSKSPDGRYSVSHFDNSEGNIRFKRLQHTWKDGKCMYCGAPQKSKLGDEGRGSTLETYAYEWIHNTQPEKIYDMKFDVIISNPPYQLGFGIEGTNSANARSIYNLFIDTAKKLNPRYVVMITPSRWMTKTAQAIPEDWVDGMLSENKIEELHDFPDAADCFPGVDIKGGVSYFKWNRDYSGKCKYVYHCPGNNGVNERFDYLDALGAGVVIRDPNVYSILDKITQVEGKYYADAAMNMSGLVSPKHFFDNSTLLTSNWRDYKLTKDDKYNIKYYVSKASNDTPFGYISLEQLPKNHGTLPLHKVYIPAAGGTGTDDVILGKPFYGEPNSVCSQTYLVLAYDPKTHNFTKEQCQNLIKYIRTKFFRFLVSIKKKTQNGPRGVYQFVPIQDFTLSWSDEALYAKYNLSTEEIDLIESSIREMDGGEA